MADPVWPMDIDDRPLINPPYEPRSNMESFAVEGGEDLDITAPLMAEAPLRMAPTYPMPDAQYQRWQAWWITETKSGTVPFALRDPYDREVKRWRLQTGQQISVRKPHPLETQVTLPLVKVP